MSKQLKMKWFVCTQIAELTPPSADGSRRGRPPLYSLRSHRGGTSERISSCESNSIPTPIQASPSLLAERGQG